MTSTRTNTSSATENIKHNSTGEGRINTLPFAEWSDQEVAAEKWDLPKTQSGKSKDDRPPTASAKSAVEEQLLYTDTQRVKLPTSIATQAWKLTWKRPSEIFPDIKLVIYEEKSEYSDLKASSKHLLHSEFVRSFISSIGILEYLGDCHPFQAESVSTKFFPNTYSSPWRAWHHVYSMTKVGKGQRHNPQVNQLGKYIVRLFWMGCWRKVLIDDLLPVDGMNHVFLPTFPIPEYKPPEVPDTPQDTKGFKGKGKKDKADKGVGALPAPALEIWPFLLSKALLKIASITWTDDAELVDFDIIHCLTGWIVQKIDTRGENIVSLWELCTAYSDHYAWENQGNEENVKGALSRTASKAAKKGKGKDSKSSKSKSSLKSKKGKSSPDLISEQQMRCHVVAFNKDMKSCTEEEVPDISPCWSHSILLDQTRDIPLVKPEPKPELPRWKRFRYLAWAIRNGLIPPEDILQPMKCVKLVSSFRKFADHLVYAAPPSEESLNIQKSIEILDKLALEEQRKREKQDSEKASSKGSSKAKLTKGGKDSSKSSKGSKDKSSKSSKSKSSKGSKGKSKQDIALPPPPDPSIWCDFNKLGSYIDSLVIYLKPSHFKTNACITDVSFEGKITSGNQEIKTIYHPTTASRKEPIYFFMDSIDTKLVVFTLSHSGNIHKLDKPEEKKKKVEPQPCDEEVEEGYKRESRLPSLGDLLKNRKMSRQLESGSRTSAKEETEDIPEEPIHPRPLASFVIYSFEWYSNCLSDPLIVLNSYGINGTLVNFTPGRFAFRLWVKSETPFYLYVLSDVNIAIGSEIDILQSMAQESQSITDLYYHISSCFGNVVSKFGTDEYLSALLMFYNSYKPQNMNLTKLQSSKLHESFLKYLWDILRKNFAQAELKDCELALRVAFFDPNIKCKTLDEEVIQETTMEDDLGSLTSEDIDILKELERSAAKLQSFFKRLYFKSLRATHSPEHKNHFKVFGTLKKIYTVVFGAQHRLHSCHYIMQNIFKDSNLNEINYHIKQELQLVTYPQTFSGEAIANVTQWMLICRYVFHVNSPESLVVRITLLCDLPVHLVRVFNNDNGEEYKRYIDNVATIPYTSNFSGYTVLCYGWCEAHKKIPWKLILTTLKNGESSCLAVENTHTEMNILSNCYKPNVYNRICNCAVNLQKPAFLTFRLTASSEDVMLSLRCSREDKMSIAEITGMGSIILPIVYLEFEPQCIPSVTSSTAGLKRNKSRSSSSLNFADMRRRDFKSDKGSESSRVSKTGNLTKRMRQDNRHMLYKDVVLFVEGYVLDKSWPLTKQEWTTVERYKEANLLRSDNINSRISMHTFVKNRDNPSAIKLRDQSRRHSDKAPVLHDKPFWCLQTIYNSGDTIRVTIDRRREEEIKNIKRAWYENNPKRYEMSQAIRNEYLINNYQTLDQFGYLEDDDELKTYAKKPESATKISPPFILETYMNKILETTEDLDDRKVKTDLDYKAEEEGINQLILNFQRHQMQFQSDMYNYLMEQVVRCKLLNRFITNCRKESEDIIQDGFKARQKYIDSLVPPVEEQPQKPTKKGKKKK